MRTLLGRTWGENIRFLVIAVLVFCLLLLSPWILHFVALMLGYQ